MNRRYKIKNGIKKTGKEAVISDGDWRSMPFYAVIQHHHKNTKTEFEDKLTEIGFVSREYYTYIGPFDHDITALSDDAVIKSGAESYVFKKKEAVTVGSETIYYYGILKKLREGLYD